jgi:hypothetical protein
VLVPSSVMGLGFGAVMHSRSIAMPGFLLLLTRD